MVVFRGLHGFLKELLAVHHFRLLGGERFPVDQLFEVGVKKPLLLHREGGHFGLLLADSGTRSRCEVLALLFEHREHGHRPLVRKCVGGEDGGKLDFERFFTNERLGALDGFRFFRAAIVGVALLDFSGDGHAAGAAAENTSEGFGCPLGFNVLRSPGKDGLNIIEQLLRDDGRVLPFVKFTGIFEVSVVEGIPQNPPNLIVVEVETALESCSALSRENAIVGEKRLHGVEGRHSLGIDFEGTLHDWGDVGINHDGFGSLVVLVA